VLLHTGLVQDGGGEVQDRSRQLIRRNAAAARAFYEGAELKLEGDEMQLQLTIE
jgi:hypothetical protein